MGFGWIRTLALPVLLLTFLAACQAGPYDRSYQRTAGLSYSPGPGGYGGGYGGYGGSYGGCGYDRCNPPRVCPPGYVLARIPYAYGGPGRYCKPYHRRCCAPKPSPCGYPAPGPCGRPYAAY